MSPFKTFTVTLCLILFVSTSQVHGQETAEKKKASSWAVVGVHKKQSFKVVSVVSIVEGLSNIVILSNQPDPVIGFLKPGEAHTWLVVDRGAKAGAKLTIKKLADPSSLGAFISKEGRKKAGLPADKALDFAHAICFTNDSKAVSRYRIGQPDVAKYSATDGAIRIQKHEAGKRMSASFSALFSHTQIAGTIDYVNGVEPKDWARSKQDLCALSGGKVLEIKDSLLKGEDHADFLVLSTKKDFLMGRLTPGETQIWILLEKRAKSGSILPLKKITAEADVLKYVDISTRKELKISPDKVFGHFFALKVTNTTDKLLRMKFKEKEMLAGTALSGAIQLKAYEPRKMIRGKITLQFKDLQIFGNIDVTGLKRR